MTARFRSMETRPSGASAAHRPQAVHITAQAVSASSPFSRFLQATQSAIRNNQREKIEALENAVINSALPDAPGEVYQQIYLALIDDLSTMHVRVLQETSGIIVNTDEQEFLSKVFTDFPQQKELYLHVWNDLLGKQLIRVFKTATHSLNISRTKLGHGFVSFISRNDG